MSTSKSLLFACVIVAGTITACNNQTSPEKKAQKGLPLDSLITKHGAGNAFISEQDARTLKHNFDRFHRNKSFYNPDGNISVGGVHPSPADDMDVPIGTPNANDSLSRAVWIDKDVIDYLNDILQNNGSIDGIRIYFGAYNGMGHPNQQYYHQATVFIVPTDQVGTADKHKDNYSYIERLKAALHNKFDGALNHGELCPTNCTQ
jgi:hypothetical protein